MYLEDLFKALEEKVPTITDDLYLRALQYGSRKFFMESEVWQVPLDLIPVAASAVLFELDAPADATIHSIHAVVINGETIKSVSFPQIRSSQQYNGRPTEWYRQGRNMHIAPCPTASFNIEVLAVLVPDRNHIEISADEYADKYADAITSAAAVYLLDMPRKPWSNAQSSNKYRMEYEGIKLIARREALGYLDKETIQMRSTSSNANRADY